MITEVNTVSPEDRLHDQKHDLLTPNPEYKPEEQKLSSSKITNNRDSSLTVHDDEILSKVLIRKRRDGTFFTYNVIDLIGKGGFGVVYSAIESPGNRRVALKCTSKKKLQDPKVKKKLVNEVEIHRSLDHINIVKFLGIFHDDDFVYFILELCEGGNVLEYLRKKEVFSESIAADITRQILDSLVYLHAHGIIHRDIKLQNFLISSNGTIKLSDFGLSIKMENIRPNEKLSILGTPGYLSPEVVTKGSHTFAIDIWAMGISVFLMLTGRQPFRATDKKTTFAKIRHVIYSWPSTPLVSENARSFVDAVLRRNPNERPTSSELLHFPFLTNKKNNIQPVDSTPVMAKSNSYCHVPVVECTDGCLTSSTCSSSLLRLSNNTNNINNQNNNIYSNNNNNNSNSNSNNFPENAVHIWWDLSCKYGLGYILYNGCVGACFNDSSRMILDQSERFAQFYMSPHAEMELIRLDDDEKEVSHKKKVALIKHFSRELRRKANNPKSFAMDDDNLDIIENTPLEFVKYWASSENGVLFRMKDKSLQANFVDRTRVYVFADTKEVIYDDTTAVTQRKTLSELIDRSKNQEIRAKFALAKEMGKKLE